VASQQHALGFFNDMGGPFAEGLACAVPNDTAQGLAYTQRIRSSMPKFKAQAT